MNFSNLSFLNPLSKNSGVKLSKYSITQPVKGADKIQDKTVVENVQHLYQDYQNTKKHHVRTGSPDYGFFTEVRFTYQALTGLHYGVYTNLNEPKEEGVGGIGAKGILDFLIFPLLARKLLWDSLIFVSNDENYRLSGTFDDLTKGICWVGLIPSVALALSLEIIRLSLASAVAILSVYTALFASVIASDIAIVTSPIWLSIYAVYSYCSTEPSVDGNDERGNDDTINVAKL